MSVDLSTKGALKLKNSTGNVLTITPPSFTADYSTSYGRQVNRSTLIAAAATLDVGMSGSVINVNPVGGFTITLPALANSVGVVYDIVCTTAAAGDVKIQCPDGAHINGIITRAGTTSLIAAPNTNVNFLNAAALAGDHLHLVCNGYKWQAFGSTGAAAGMSFT